MIKVVKEHNWGQNNVISIQTKEGSFYISFERDLNLYFSYSGNNLEDKNEYKFTINKENPFIYECFDNLYDSIMSERPYRYSKNLANTEYVYPLSKCCCELVHGDDIIDWHSDDEPYDLANVLRISKDEDDNYIVCFINGKKSSLDTVNSSVRIRNGNSYYDPYNASFMIMYNNLREHDFELDNNIQNKESFVRTRKR